jgi:hypothetical protein
MSTTTIDTTSAFFDNKWPTRSKIEGYLTESPVLCEFKLGDLVEFTNEFGVIFQNMVVIGFSVPDPTFRQGDSFIHINTLNGGGAHWFPHSVKELKLMGE